MAKPHHWNDWADGVSLILQTVVYVPLLYIIFMPWLCLALVSAGAVPFLPGFFQAMAATGWLVASGLTVLAILINMVRTSLRKRKRRAELAAKGQ